MRILERRFFSRDTVEVAKELLGKFLVRQFEKGEIIGKIVEVEAYKGRGDPASHAYRGYTQRNKILFSGSGLVYVYLIYGTYHCLCVTTKERGVVLLRALEPIKGIEIMQKNRPVGNLLNLTNGPGKLTQALSITRKQYGLDLTKGKDLFICDGEMQTTRKITTAKRIGINVAINKPWRFYLSDNKFVSKK